MSNLWDPGREGILDQTISLPNAVIKCALVRGYTYSASHKFVSDLTGASGVIAATSAALASKTFTSGAFDAADFSFTSVSGAQDTGMMVYQASAVGGGADVAAGSQRLICWFDSGTGLPITPNGTNIDITFDNTSLKIFKI